MKQSNLLIKYVISGLMIIICLSFLIVGKPIADFVINNSKIFSYNLQKYASIFGPSYGSTEQYTFNVTRKELASAIFNFLNLNPYFIPPPKYEYFSNQEYDFNDVFSPIYFYFQDADYIAVTLLSGNSNSQESILGLYIVTALNDSTYGKDKILNSNIDYYENQRLLKMFEDRIVNPLRKQIEKNRIEK